MSFKNLRWAVIKSGRNNAPFEQRVINNLLYWAQSHHGGAEAVTAQEYMQHGFEKGMIPIIVCPHGVDGVGVEDFKTDLWRIAAHAGVDGDVRSLKYA